MRTHARAVVIGGGVVGVSTLYHLARKGWTDSVLIERKELTSGSTWHAAGLLPLFNLSYSVGQIHKYSVALYQTLETGDRARRRPSPGVEHPPRAHPRPDGRIQLLRRRRGDDRRQGEVPDARRGQGDLAALRCRGNHRRDPAPRGRLHPARRPDAGAGARRARARGRDQPPDDRHGIERLPSGEWKVSTDKGDITCEHVVSATGNFARQTGRMVGINVPVIPVEHQYIVTEAHPEIVKRKAQGLPEMGVLRRIGFLLVHARGGGRPAARPVRKGRARLLCRRAVGDKRIRALSRGPRSPRAPYRNRDRARSRLRRGRRQEGLQRRHRLYARRLADRRPRAGGEELLAQRGPFVRRHRRRRRRLATRRMDRRRRADHRHARRRSAPLRPLRGHGLSHREERGGLREGLHRALSRRGARGRAPAAPDALLWADEGSRRRVRLGLRLGAAELVRARRATA